MNELEKEYLNDLNKIKETIRTNQNKAMVVVNSAMIMTYYEIGTIINESKVWGDKYIPNLANDLKEYGKGYSKQNLYRMSQIAAEYTHDELFSQPAREIPWFTLVEITHKSNSHKEMLWYINETHKHGWSRSMVLNQFGLKAYERSLIEPTTSNAVTNDDLSNELFKDTYVFDFIDKNSIKTEKDLKNQMIDNIILFLQELGPGFCLVGKEYKLIIPTNEEFYIDILLYHTKIHAYVVIEVKIGKFSPSDLGQLIFYVNAIDDLERTDKDEETIGLILFLQELGPGFCLVGKEYKLITPTNEEFFIDILLYHTKIHAYVVIEVKIGKFSPSDLGQLIFYVNAVNKLERTNGDEETIGLLLCKDADKFVAETTLENSMMKLGISKYKFIEELPEYLNKKLNNGDK